MPAITATTMTQPGSAAALLAAVKAEAAFEKVAFAPLRPVPDDRVSVVPVTSATKVTDAAAPSVAPANQLEAKVQSTFFDPGLGQTLHYQPRRLPLAMGISSFAGLLSGLFGIGGGLIKVPALVQLCGVPIKAAAMNLINHLNGTATLNNMNTIWLRHELLVRGSTL